MYVFKTLSEVRAITEEWIEQYNEDRPHQALEDLKPFEYREAPISNENPLIQTASKKGMITQRLIRVTVVAVRSFGLQFQQ
tara:strand:+ start:485 stop:727 length:243 start_codon:yes stop_codon:yes gene_type:complete